MRKRAYGNVKLQETYLSLLDTARLVGVKYHASFLRYMLVAYAFLQAASMPSGNVRF